MDTTSDDGKAGSQSQLKVASAAEEASSLPIIYVVTPCRNAGSTIDQTIRSIVTQPGAFCLRYHVQDGGSTDNTISVLEHWRQQLESRAEGLACAGVTFSYSSTPDEGMYDAVATAFEGLAIPADAFMTWLNADDALCPGALATVANVQTSCPSVSWITGSVFATRASSALSEAVPCGYPTAFIEGGLCEHRYWRFIQQEGTFWRKSLWDKVNGVNRGLRLAGDFDLWVRFAHHEPLWHFATPLGSFRRRPGQMSEQLQAYDAEVDRIRHKPDADRLWLDVLRQLAEEDGAYPVQVLTYDWDSDNYIPGVRPLRAYTARAMFESRIPDPPRRRDVLVTLLDGANSRLLLLEQRLAASEAEHAAHLNVIRGLQSQLEFSQRNRAARLAALHALRAQLLRERVMRLQNVQTLHSQITALEVELETTRHARQQETHQLQQQLENFQSRVTALELSRSWRWTAFARRLAGVAGRSSS